MSTTAETIRRVDESLRNVRELLLETYGNSLAHATKMLALYYPSRSACRDDWERKQRASYLREVRQCRAKIAQLQAQ